MNYSNLSIYLSGLFFILTLQKITSSAGPEQSLNWTVRSSAATHLAESARRPMNWIRLTSRNFMRLVRTTKKVAESRDIEVFLAQASESENNAYFIATLHVKIGPIILTVRNSTQGVDPLAKLVLVVVGDDLNIRDLIDLNGTDSLWTSTNYYIIVTAVNPPNIVDVFRDLWNIYFVSNVIFYTTDGNEVVSVYNPFKNATEVTAIRLKNIARIKRSITKKMNDLNGYPLRVSIFQNRLKAYPLGNGSFAGPDGVILSTLAKRMNFKPKTFAPADGQRYGYKAENGTFTGVLGDLINDRADISFNSIFIKDYETTRIQFTRPIDFDKLCLIVAKSGLRPHWKGMFLAFSIEMWVALLLTFTFGITFWSFLRKINYGEYSIILTALDLYRIFVMFPIKKFPSILSERIAVVSFLWFSLSTATIFQSSMVKFLSYPSYEPDINTLKEVADKDLPILTASQNLQEVFESDEPLMKKLLDNFQLLTGKNADALRTVAYEGNAAALGRMNDAEERIAASFVKNNVVLLHIVPDCPKGYHIAYMLPSDSPFLESINKVISSFVESGIINSWYIHSTPYRPLSDYHQTQETYKPLTMQNVVIAFIIIMIGSGLSTVAFIVEIVTRKLNRGNKGSRKHYVWNNKLFRRSRTVYETTRKRFKSFKVA